jgi:hypothetical protein
VLHVPPISFFPNLITWIRCGLLYRSLSSSLSNCLQSPYLAPLRPKYSYQYPVLQHPQPTFFPQCERPSFATIKNKR